MSKGSARSRSRASPPASVRENHNFIGRVPVACELINPTVCQDRLGENIARESWKRSRVSQGGDRGFERCYCTMTALNRADVKERLQARRAEILAVKEDSVSVHFL